MSLEADIERLADDLGIQLAAMPAVSPDNRNTYHVIVTQSASSKAIRNLKSTFEERGIVIRVSSYGEDQDSFRNALLESLRLRFSDAIYSSVITKRTDLYQVLIILNDASEDMQKKIRIHVNEVSSLFDTAISLQIEENAAHPTATEFLMLVRRTAPADCETLQASIISRGYPEPSQEWVNHQFDRLRKSGFLQRLPNKTYVLTQGGLRALGSGRGRNSPDVVRLLDLARRG